MRIKFLVGLAVLAVLLVGAVATMAVAGKFLGRCCGHCQLLSSAE